MKSKTTRPTLRIRIGSRRLVQGGVLAVFGAFTLAMVGAAIWLSSDDDDDGGSASGATVDGGPAVVQIPIANDPQVAAGVRIVEPAVDRGKLPLNTTVRHVYELANVGSGIAEFGEPTIEVLDGCCPPEPVLGPGVIGTGEKAFIAISMQMHEGMDGPHLFHLTVPVRSTDGEAALHLYFKGDFGG